ncbi:MAG: hypothetical protein NZ480_06750 [Bdellovibrionaceae bacterium]|nr:hypothetical protein [Pseudobdellovibrionaceae bacterium]MDW8190210.1 hypothetical protein [Pseudobdellovibrionaceae bacterium]
MLKFDELWSWSIFAHPLLVGSQLQKIEHIRQGLVFTFYGRRLIYLVFVSSPRRGLLFIANDHWGWTEEKKTSPLLLFVRAHFLNMRVSDLSLDKNAGRVIRITFAHGGFWEFVLIPGVVNLGTYYNNKRVTLYKPLPIPPLPESESVKCTQYVGGSSVVDFASEYQRWQALLGSLRKDGEPPSSTSLTQEEFVRRKQRQLAFLDEDLKTKAQDLKVLEEIPQLIFQDLRPKEEISTLLKKWKLDWDGTNAGWIKIQDKYYGILKKLREKIGATEEKRKDISEQSYEDWLALMEQKQAVKAQLEKVQAQVRQFQVDQYQVIYGKSGVDNLKLLRVSKPYDFWIHDAWNPGAHYIVKLAKNQNLPREHLVAICQGILKQESREEGEFVGTYVRYVTPIKGASPGMVRYQNEIRMRVTLPHH